MTSSTGPERDEHAIRTAATSPSGRYPIDRRTGEIERLRSQADAMAPDSATMLDRIGVRPGWRCLDLGCGPGGITELLCARAGVTGQVVGFDRDQVFLDAARARAGDRAGLAFVQGDAYRTGLPSGSFDLVHVRFVAGTAGEPATLLEEMIRLTHAGGTVAFQEPDVSTLNCYPPHPAWTRLRDALTQAFAAVGADVQLAQRLFRMVRHSGLEDVQYRPFLVGVRSGDPMTDYLPATMESIRGTLLDNKVMCADELDAALAACRAHLADPDTVFTTFTVAQVWGRLPGLAAPS